VTRTLASEPWINAPETKRVMTALTREGAKARFVGGCVRNALIGAAVEDIDIATQDEPQVVTRLLESAGIRVVPTGIAHGTVTAVTGHRHFEVTSLRRDVETDGRRAVVAFTRDFAEDAARRDFTMNAIYAEPDGTLYDPVGGVADLEAGRVRFIGEARARIAEDYLRILRFFRMHAWYGKGLLDREGLAACAAAADGLQRLSAERVQKELLRLLEAPNPAPVLRAMAAVGVLARVLPEAQHIDRLERLCVIEAQEGLAPAPVRRLGALIALAPAGVQALARRLKLSNDDRARLAAMAEHSAQAVIPAEGAAGPAEPGSTMSGDRLAASVPGSRIAQAFARASGMTDKEAARALYAQGVEAFVDRLLLQWAEDTSASAGAWRRLLCFALGWTKPVFPLQGRDLVAAGVPHGPEVGRLMASLEAWWIEQGFRPDRQALLAQLDDLKRA
jgi:poly(A) polymerase